MHWIKKLLNSLGLMHPCGCGMDDPAQQPRPGTPGLPTHDGKAYYIKVSAQADGTFTVTKIVSNQFLEKDSK